MPFVRLDNVGQTAIWQLRDKTIAELPFGHSTDFTKTLNCHLAAQTQTQTEPEAYKMHQPR